MKERGRCVIWDRIFFHVEKDPDFKLPSILNGSYKNLKREELKRLVLFLRLPLSFPFLSFPRLYRELCCCTAQPPEVRLEKEQKSKRREREPRGSGTELIRQGQHQEFVITPQWSRESRLFRFQSWTIGCEEDLPTDVCFQFQPERPAKKTVTPISPEG